MTQTPKPQTPRTPNLLFRVNKLLDLKPAEIIAPPPGAVLYGPNGSGKSILMRITAALLARAVTDAPLPPLFIDALETARRLGASIEVCYAGTCIGDDNIIMPAWTILYLTDSGEMYQVGSRPCTVFNPRPSLHDFTIACPDIARHMELEVYYDRVYRNRWVRIMDLSYGERKMLAIDAMLSAAHISSAPTFVFIENFDSGLHVTSTFAILDSLPDNGLVVLEAHNVSTIKRALQSGLAVYYVGHPETREVLPITIDSFTSDKLFALELAAYQT